MSDKVKQRRTRLYRIVPVIVSLFSGFFLSGCGFGWLYMRIGDSHRIKALKTLANDKTQKRFRIARKHYKTALDYYDDSVLYDEFGNPEVYYKAGETALQLNPPNLKLAETNFRSGISVMRHLADKAGLTSADRMETTSSGIQYVLMKDQTYSQMFAGMGMVNFYKGIEKGKEEFFDTALQYFEIAEEVSIRYEKHEQTGLDKILDWFDLTEIVTPTPVPVLMARLLNYRGKMALMRGDQMLADSYFAQSEENLDRVKSYAPNDTRLLAEYTQLHFLRKEYDRCTQYLDTILKTKVYADKVRYTILKANILNETGKHEEAIALFTEILDLDMTNIECLVGRAMGYAQLGNDTSALADLENFLTAQDEEDPKLYLAAGRIYYILKRFDSAEQMMLKAYYKSPNDIEINYELGKLFRAVGKKQEMESAFRRVIRLGPMSTFADDARKFVSK